MDERIKKLSEIIINYSLKVEKGEKVLITVNTNKSNNLVKQLIQNISEKQASAYLKHIDLEIDSYLLELTDQQRIETLVKQKEFEINNYDSFIVIRYIDNDYEGNKIKSEIRKKVGKATEELDNIRINQRKWVLLNFPSHLDAYKAKMTNDDYYNFAMDVMTIDYEKLHESMIALKKIMEKTDKVRITGKETDLTFSIKNIPAIICAGKSNIPDGEIYTAPVLESVNGYISYNVPSPYQGKIYNNIKLTFENGKIITATSNEPDIEAIFNIDEGARYIGEFAIGINPNILHPIGDILFDEKIFGSIHFTPGRCYDDASNGNKSSIHWDLVFIQRKEYGGGEIYFDDILIRKDGYFVIPELKHLNFENNL